MIRFGTIGTSAICEKFITSAKNNVDVKIAACYSRDLERAKKFIAKNNIKKTAVALNNFEDMIDVIDAIYIASPNGLHFTQAKYFLSNQVHVFCEKPITFTTNEAIELKEIANRNNVILMEAFKTIHLPQYKHLHDMVKNTSPFIANFVFNQYSSRIPQVKNGIFDSVFDAQLGKGSLYDTLIYPVELAISLFGQVSEVKAFSQKIPNGVDLSNVVLLKHSNNVLVTITNSKACTGITESEIASDEVSLSFSRLTTINQIKLFTRSNNEIKTIFEENHQNDFDYEVDVFADLVNSNNFEMRDYLLDLSIEAIRVLNLIEINELKIGEQ